MNSLICAGGEGDYMTANEVVLILIVDGTLKLPLALLVLLQGFSCGKIKCQRSNSLCVGCGCGLERYRLAGSVSMWHSKSHESFT